MGSVEVIEVLPFIEFGFQIDVALVAEQLIKFLSIGAMKSLNFPVELRSAAFDIGMADAKVFDMPMEFGLELVAVVRTDFA